MAYIDNVTNILQIQPDGLPTFVRLSQNENGRNLYFQLAGNEINIPANSTITISGTKPDGTVYSGTGSISDNVILIPEMIQMTAVAGYWDAKVKIISGGNTIATGRIRFVIDADTVDPDSVPSDSELEGLVAEAQQYAETARTEAYGSPLTAQTVAGMTDHTRVYVYTGSESGYTAGHWYFWNGSAWTDGGIYNSTAVNTDTTLTLAGVAADAKTTGDAIEAARVAIDDTLTNEGEAADAAAVGSEISGLKEDLSSEIESVYNALTYAEALNIPVTWEYGTIDASGSEVFEDRKYYARTTDYIVFEKDVTLNARYISNASSNLIVLTFDSSGTMTSRMLYYNNSDISALALTANTRYRFVYMASSSTVINLNKMTDYITLQTSTLIESMSELLSMVASAMDYDNDVVVSVPVTPTLGYMFTTGATFTNNSYGYTNKINVSEGDVLRMVAKANGKSSIMRFVTAFANGSAVSASGATNVQSYTVPNGINEVVITGYVGTDGDTTTFPYVFKFTKGNVTEINDGNGFVIKSDTLDDADTIFIPLNNISKNTVLSFDAKVTSFSALEFGRTGYEDVIRITDSNVIILDKNGDTISTTAHGLTIINTISVRFQQMVLDNIDIIISSNGVIANTITKGWTKPSNGKPYVTSDGSTLTDCALSYAPMDINKKTWVFGDSYCSITFNRWMGQLSIAGFLNNILLNAYAGESAAQNIPALMNLIDKGNAQCIVWANGMNDGSDTDALVSTMWINAVNVFVTACQSRGIIPILATIPTVPNINNEKKNAWVRSSGHRYIDFAKAVGANASGEWYSGMLSNDAVHPTEQGAIALFNRAIADCPELMEY